MHVFDTTDNILISEQKSEQLHCRQTNSSNNAVKYHQIMNSDNESDDDNDDLELLKTLSQLHGIINSEQIHDIESQISTNSPDINQEENSVEYLTKNRNNEIELINEKKQVKNDIILSSPYDIETIIQSDEEREEKNEKKNIIIYKNHNNVNGDDMQKEKYEQKEEKEDEEEKGEEKKATTFFSLTSSTSPFLYNDDSHSPIVILNPDASSTLSNVSYSLNNQLITESLQISKTRSNMNNLHNDEQSQQTTNLFDPFAPTETMFDDLKPIDDENKTQPLANYNFDDLWNQSISNLESTPEQIDPNTFDWNTFLNSEQQTNPFDDNNKNLLTTDITWNSLFNEEEEEETKNDLKVYLNWILNHLHENEKEEDIFHSILNLETIMKDIQMSVIPFDPIPSPPLHIDHTVSNPLINGIHHDLFPINELEPTNIFQGQQSMTLYEEDENEIDDEKNIFSFEDYIQPIIEKLVSHTLELALKQVNEYYEPIEHFVEQILSQAIFEIYNEEQEEENQVYKIENLTSIINEHNQIKTTDKQKILDPFDQKFDSVWSQHFQAPDDDTINENIFQNQDKNDPWLTTTASTDINQKSDSMILFNKTFDESDLFSSSTNNQIPDVENDQTTTLSEYLPSPLLINPSTTMDANNIMKYTLTAPVIDDSGDDSSTLEDYFISRKVISLFILILN